MEVMLRVMSLAIPSVIVIIKYITFLLLPASVSIQYDCTMIFLKLTNALKNCTLE